MIVPYINMMGNKEIFVVHWTYIIGNNGKFVVRTNDMMGKKHNFVCFLHEYVGDWLHFHLFLHWYEAEELSISLFVALIWILLMIYLFVSYIIIMGINVIFGRLLNSYNGELCQICLVVAMICRNKF